MHRRRASPRPTRHTRRCTALQGGSTSTNDLYENNQPQGHQPHGHITLLQSHHTQSTHGGVQVSLNHAH